MLTQLVFVTTHPIQYQAPIFRVLASSKEIQLHVLFAMLPNSTMQGAGFDVEFDWDIPLLDGYQYTVLKNVSANPSVTNFSGCDTPGVLNELRVLKPDAVVVNGWVVKTCLQTLWACKRLNIPCLVRGEANDLRPRPWWKVLLQRILVHQYDACLYIGEASRAFYSRRGIAAKKLFSAPYCIENERFETAAQNLFSDREKFRQKWGIPEDAVCFAFCGKFETKKHPIELIESFAAAYSRQSNLHLLMVGDGVLRAQCEARVRNKNLPVSFSGFLNQSEIVTAYVAADCLVLPSDAGETWGLVVNEAMACGKPAIVSDLVGCAADLIEPGVTGDSFRFGDWSGLTDLLVRYGSARETLADMGKAARIRIRNFSPQKAAAGISKGVNRIRALGAARD